MGCRLAGSTVDGFLNLHKGAGLTSHDCVARVRRLLRQKRVGHGGTLDPAATGVLPIALGRATRLLQFLRQDKAYRAVVRFGLQTTTDDLEGDVVAKMPVPDLTLEAIQAVLPQFVGCIQQVPPSYSAIQVEGTRLYTLARAGQVVAAPVRTVEVKRIDLVSWQPGPFPELELAIACGPGTYIRSIARDLGQRLGVGGTLASLVRTESHGFSLADSLTLEELTAQIEADTFCPHPPEAALGHLTAWVLPEALVKRWCHGQRLTVERDAAMVMDQPLRIEDETGHFLGIGQIRDHDGAPILSALVVWAEIQQT